MKKNAIIGMMTFLAFVTAVGIVGLHYNERQLYREEIAMTSSDRDYLLMVLKKRSAGDCIVEPTGYGWKCTDFKGRIFKVIKDENKMKAARLNAMQKSDRIVMSQAEIP
ncbi:MAG: hypothetical protein K4571_03945 [Deltaproteobacteria bacterium]